MHTELSNWLYSKNKPKVYLNLDNNTKSSNPAVSAKHIVCFYEQAPFRDDLLQQPLQCNLNVIVMYSKAKINGETVQAV